MYACHTTQELAQGHQEKVLQLQYLVSRCNRIDLNTLLMYTFVRNRYINRVGAQIPLNPSWNPSRSSK